MNKIWIVFIVAIMSLTSVMAISDVDVILDVDSGFIEVDVVDTNTDVNFKGMGQFEGYVIATGNSNGLFDTNVLVESVSGSSLNFAGEQKLFGHTDNKIKVESYVFGSQTLMNNRFDTSNYVVQFERVDTSKDLLKGIGDFGIGFSMSVEGEESQSALTYVELIGSGMGRFDTNQWHSTAIGSYGWGNPDTINMPNEAGYYVPTNEVEAEGDGIFTQYGFGENSLNFNGFVLGSGTALITANYQDGIIGNFNMRAN